jgi:hypothetical protein
MEFFVFLNTALHWSNVFHDLKNMKIAEKSSKIGQF